MAENILVVEDDTIIRTSVSDTLRKAGYDATEARDGEEAFQLLEQLQFDLVICDFIIPKIHGFKLVELIRSKWPHLPILLMTGYVSANSAKTILQGMAEFIEKPIDPEILPATVRRLLGQRS
jgi:two-component system, response regulator FlrC